MRPKSLTRLEALEARLTPAPCGAGIVEVHIYDTPEELAAAEAFHKRQRPGQPFYGVEGAREEAYLADLAPAFDPRTVFLILDGRHHEAVVYEPQP